MGGDLDPEAIAGCDHLVWGDRLNALRVLRHGLGRGKTGFFFFSKTPWADRLLALLHRVRGGAIEVFPLKPHISYPDEDGAALVYRALKVAAKLTEAVLGATDAAKFAPPLLAHVKRELRRGLHSDFIAHWEEHLVAPILVEYLCRVGVLATSRAKAGSVVYVEGPLSSAVAGALPSILNLQGARVRGDALEGIRVVLGALALPAYYAARAIWTSLKPVAAGCTNVPDDAVRKGTIFVEYTKGQMLRYPYAGPFSWVDACSADKARIVMYCDRGDSPCDRETKSTIQSLGISWLDMANPMALMGRGAAGIVRETARYQFRLRPFQGLREWWLWRATMRALVVYMTQKAIAERYNVKVVHQHQQFSSVIAMGIVAARDSGAMYLWSSRSFYHYPMLRNMFGFADLFVSWGPYSTGEYAALGFEADSCVEVGVNTGDGNWKKLAARSRELRETVLARGAKKVLAVFDSSLCMEFSDETLSSFYRAVVELLERNPDWGALFKCKRPKTNKFIDPGVRARIAELEDTGRVITLQRAELVTVTAQAADASVCYTINTAGVVTALSGRPAVHLDEAYWTKHPFVLRGDTKDFIATDVPAFIEMTEAAMNGDETVGRLGAWSDACDPFRDGHGNERIGELIGRYVEALDGGCQKRAALRLACESYGDAWGAERVYVDGLSAYALPNRDIWRQCIAACGIAIEPNPV